MDANALPPDTILFSNLGSYCIEEVLGSGGFGITYRASALIDGESSAVAIKEFFPRSMCSRSVDTDSTDVIIDSVDKFDSINKLRQRFVKESRNIEQCDHPSIVRVRDTIECNGTAYMVMDLIEGNNLKQLMPPHGGYPANEAFRIIEQIADALEYLHNKKIAHLDIKPDNIMIARDDNRPILIDFGLSRHFKNDGSSDSEILTALSRGYASPEQYKGITHFSPKYDIYSLGATFYTLLTGKKPPEPRDLRNNAALLTFPKTAPVPFVRAIKAAMEYKPERRPASMAEFVRIIKGKQKKVRKTSDGTHKSKFKHFMAQFFVTILLLGVVAASVTLIFDTDFKFHKDEQNVVARTGLAINALWMLTTVFKRRVRTKTIVLIIGILLLIAAGLFNVYQ